MTNTQNTNRLLKLSETLATFLELSDINISIVSENKSNRPVSINEAVKIMKEQEKIRESLMKMRKLSFENVSGVKLFPGHPVHTI